MMFNAKPMVATALSTDPSLLAIIPKARMSDNAYSSNNKPEHPYLTYEEIFNTEGESADDTEISSEVTIRVHLWGTASLSAAAGHVDRILKTLGMGRNYSMDSDETLDSGQEIKHKIMSFTGLFSD